MLKTFRLLIILFACALVLSGISCSSQSTTPEPEQRIVTVGRGNLTISASVDGNLVMPQAFDLRFGAPGEVKDVLVEEGDFVKAGAILARLDDSTQQLDIKSANNNVQTVLSNLYETVPRLPQFPTTLIDKEDGAPTTTTSLPITTVHTYFDPPDTLPPPGTTTETTTTGRTPGTETVIETVTTVTHTPGTTPGTTTVTTTVTTTKTTTTTAYKEREGIHPDIRYPFYYPNATALSSFAWAQDEVSRARALFLTDNYTAATSELYVALSDLESCVKIVEDAINNPASGLGNTAPLLPTDLPGITYFQLQQGQSFAISFIVELRKAVDLIKQGQAEIETVRGLISQGKYEEAGPMLDTLLSRVDDIGKVVMKNVNRIKTRTHTTVYGRDISLHFYAAAEEKLNAALKGIEEGGLNSPELHDNLRIARHYMEICNAILGSNDYVLQHGLSLKNEQQYNVDLAKALVTLGDREDDFLKTIILAPFDGTVVSVGVKKNDVLSAMDYSSRSAVQLVDTTAIKFTGLVDEIDILKVKVGQEARITVDAVPDQTFTGRVTFISPYGSKDTGTVVKFAVTIKLDPTDVELKGGLTATADITIYEIQNVLLVPLSAVTTTPAGSVVTVMNEATGQPEKRQVTLGRQNFQFAEVLDGLQDGNKVLIEEKAVIGAPVFSPRPGPHRD